MHTTGMPEIIAERCGEVDAGRRPPRLCFSAPSDILACGPWGANEAFVAVSAKPVSRRPLGVVAKGHVPAHRGES